MFSVGFVFWSITPSAVVIAEVKLYAVLLLLVLIVYCQVHAFLGEVFIIYGNIFYVSHLYIIMASMFSRLFSANRVAERFYNKNNSIKVKKQSVFHFFSFVQVSFFSLLSNWCLYCLLNDILQDCSQQNKRDDTTTERSGPVWLNDSIKMTKQLSSLFSFLVQGSIPFQYIFFACNMVPRVNKPNFRRSKLWSSIGGWENPEKWERSVRILPTVKFQYDILP